MTREERAKHASFAAIMERHAAAEQRTLADLHAAGFKFKSISEACKYTADLAKSAAASINELAAKFGER